MGDVGAVNRLTVQHADAARRALDADERRGAPADRARLRQWICVMGTFMRANAVATTLCAHDALPHNE